MGKWIDADALIESIKNTADLGGWIGEALYQIKQVAIKYIDSAPSIDIEPKRGEWKEKEVVDYEETTITQWQSARCSVCDKYHTTPYMYYFDNYNFCPYCGADMRKESE